MKRHLVIARYNEDISWSSNYSNVHVIQKGEDYPNIGREPSSYLHYILSNYENLEGKYFFLQGNPLEHCPNLYEELNNIEGDFRWFGNRNGFTCDLMGRPHDNVDIKSFLKDCGVTYSNDSITFNGCCLFMLSAERIKRQPKEWYRTILEATIKEPKSCYAFERCVEILFGDEPNGNKRP